MKKTEDITPEGHSGTSEVTVKVHLGVSFCITLLLIAGIKGCRIAGRLCKSCVKGCRVAGHLCKGFV